MPAPTLVLYDGLCPLCRKTTALLKRLDWLHRLRFHDCRDPAGLPPTFDPARLTAEMHVLTPDGKTALSGFRAVRWIAARVPVLWPVLPLLFVPGMARLGQRAYLWVARNRFRLLPCRDGVCTIPPGRE